MSKICNELTKVRFHDEIGQSENVWKKIARTTNTLAENDLRKLPWHK